MRRTSWSVLIILFGVIAMRQLNVFRSRLLLGICLTWASPLLWAEAIPLASATIADLNAAFKAGTLTSEQLVTRYLARIEAYDKQGPKLMP